MWNEVNNVYFPKLPGYECKFWFFLASFIKNQIEANVNRAHILPSYLGETQTVAACLPIFHIEMNPKKKKKTRERCKI